MLANKGKRRKMWKDEKIKVFYMVLDVGSMLGSNPRRIIGGRNKMRKNTPDPSVLSYVLKVKKVAAEEESELLRQASDFEAEMRAWYDWVEKKKMEEEK